MLLEEISQSHALVAELVRNGGELTPEIEAQMALTEENIARKTDQYAVFLDKLKDEVEYFEKMANDYKQFAVRLKGSSLRIKDYLKFMMQQFKMHKLKGHDTTFTLSKTKDRLLIDEEFLPKEYFESHITQKINKELVRSGLECERVIPGASLEKAYALKRTLTRRAN